jgi:hypothetical protein
MTLRTLILLALVLNLAGCAELQNGSLGSDLLKVLSENGGAAPLDERTVAAGLREALQVGTERTVQSTARVDGFLGNALIRIAVPPEFAGAANTLRQVGLGSQVDALETAMNRAAEKASGEAREVFFDVLATMTLADAFAILRGGDHAATDYFRTRSTTALRSRFQPIVREKMAEVGLYRIYDQVSRSYAALPFSSRKPAVDMESYITNKGLDGLFSVLAGEEKKIRQDPAARTTALLRRVFSGT